MDTILLEDFAAFNESYPIYEGEDYEGRPGSLHVSACLHFNWVYN